ncbi:hypothetical protein ACHAXH_000513 [Discostella pseudostelligera]
MNQADSSVERTALENENAEMTNSSSSEESMTTTEIVVNSSREHVYDPTKISLKFIFANRDGVNVILDCKPSSTVAEVKGALLSMWPKDMPQCSSGEKIRLICMGKGILSPDSKSLESAGVPVFKTHPTPINVAVRPENLDKHSGKKGATMKSYPGSPVGGENNVDGSRVGGPRPVSTGCSCVIL